MREAMNTYLRNNLLGWVIPLHVEIDMFLNVLSKYISKKEADTRPRHMKVRCKVGTCNVKTISVIIRKVL
jgi:hypothetical protein